MAKKVCVDELSLERINKLHPKLRTSAIKVLTECSQALTGRAEVRITFTLRTFAEQTALYNQGRTAASKKKGEKVVTNAKAGQSYHNFGLAFDIALIIDGKTASWDTKTDWDSDKQADWMEVVVIAKRNGWSWGGNWVNFKDMPHFEITTFNGKNYHHTELLALYNAKKVDAEGFVKI